MTVEVILSNWFVVLPYDAGTDLLAVSTDLFVCVPETTALLKALYWDLVTP